ncbi:MAG: stage III sporulation AC/AD family protein [Clostridia bacterium]|nr:stage III sporulation AC/AD family protein [Clostridia bacterium]
MSILQVAGIALLAAMVILLLREMRAAAAPPVRLVTTLVLFGAALGLYAPLLTRVRTLFALGDGGALVTAVLRAVGIGMVCEFSAAFCRDLGENTIAEGVLLFGRLEILLLAMPLVDDLIQIVGELLK